MLSHPIISKRNKVKAYQRSLGIVGIMFTLLAPSLAKAESIPEFNASFNIHALGIKLGVSNHSLACQQTENCTLTAISKPKGLAKLLLNESSLETINLRQAATKFTWLSYEKKVGSDLSDPNEYKVDAYFLNTQNPAEIINPARKQSWPAQTEIYDSTSMAYAVQFNVLNEKPLNALFLQENKRQQPLTLKKAFTDTTLELDNGQTIVNSQLFEFETERSKVKIWLLPSYHYFPGRVDVYNIKKDKTLTLVLQEPPKMQ